MRSMYNLITFIMVALLTIAASAQEEAPQVPDFPMDEDRGMVIYEAVVDLPDRSKDELYDQAINWFNDFYTNAQSVFREQDREGGKIMGRHKLRIYNLLEDGSKNQAGYMNYTIYLLFRDGKYKYQVTEIKQHASTPVPIEDMINTTDHAVIRYLQQTDAYVRELIASLKAGMAAEEKTKEVGEW